MGRAARELMEFAENESMEKNSEQLRERWVGESNGADGGIRCEIHLSENVFFFFFFTLP